MLSVYLALLLLLSGVIRGQNINARSCRDACEQTLLPFPLPGAKIGWSPLHILNSDCDYSCHVKECISGCDLYPSVLSSGSSCIQKCFGVECLQGCSYSYISYRSQVYDLCQSVNLDSHSFPNPATVSLLWTFDQSLSPQPEHPIAWSIQAREIPNKVWSTLSVNVAFQNGQAQTTVHSIDDSSQLDIGRTYEFRLLASADSDSSSISKTFVVAVPTVTPVSPHGTPELTSQLQLQHNQYLICWKQSLAADITYQVELYRDDTPGDLIVSEGIASTCYSFVQLDSAFSYTASISERNVAGVGPALEVKVELAATAPLRAETLLFANASTVSMLQNIDDYSVRETPVHLFTLDNKNDKITALSPLDLQAFLVGTEAGHVLKVPLGSFHEDVYLRDNNGAVKDISIDWMQNYTYILKDNEVIVCHNFESCQGSKSTITFPDFMKMRHVEVDPWNGYLYWILEDGQLYRHGLPETGDFTIENPEHIPLNSKATALALDLDTASLLTTTEDGSVHAYDLVTNKITDFREDLVHKDKHHNTIALTVNEGRLFWISSPCTKVHESICLMSEEENPNNQLLNLHAYLLGHENRAPVALAWLENGEKPAFLPPPHHVGFVVEDENMRLFWSPPEKFPFQNSEWRTFTYDIEIRLETSGRVLFSKFEHSEMEYLAKGTPNTRYIAQVRACWSGVCSEFVARNAGTFSGDTARQARVTLIDSNGQPFTMNLLGQIEPSDIKIDTSAVLSLSCSELDVMTGQVFWSDAKQIVTKNDLNQLMVLSNIPGVQWMAVSDNAVLFLAQKYRLETIRLTGTYYNNGLMETAVCVPSSTKQCDEILAIAVDESISPRRVVLLEKKFSDGSIQASRWTMEGQEQAFATISDPNFPRIRQMRVVSIENVLKFIFVTENGRVGIMDGNLDNIVYIPTENRKFVAVFADMSSAPTKRVPKIVNVELVDGTENQLVLQWKLNRTDKSGSTLAKVTLTPEDAALREYVFTTVTNTQQAMVASEVSEHWPSGAKLLVEIDLSNAYETHNERTNVTTPFRFPSKPTNLKLYVSHIKSTHETSVTIDFVWSAPVNWNGMPKDYSVYCSHIENVGENHTRKHDQALETRNPYEITQYQKRFVPLGVHLTCQVAAVNREKGKGEYALVGANTKDANPYVRVITLAEPSGALTLVEEAEAQEIQSADMYELMDYLDDNLYAITKPSINKEPQLHEIPLHNLMSPPIVLKALNSINSADKPVKYTGLVGDWVGQRLLIAAENDGKTTIYQYPILPSFKVALQMSQEAMKLKELDAQFSALTFDPFDDTLYYIQNDQLYSVNLHTSEPVRHLSSEIDCLSAAALGGALTTIPNSAPAPYAPLLLISENNKLLKINPNPLDGSCVEETSFTILDEHKIDTISDVAVGHEKIYLSGQPNTNLLEFGKDQKVVEHDITGEVETIVAVNKQMRHLPDESCLTLKDASSIVFSASSFGRKRIKIAVSPYKPHEACERYSQSPVLYTARAENLMDPSAPKVYEDSFNSTFMIDGLLEQTKYEVRVGWVNAYSSSNYGLSLPVLLTTSRGYASAPRQPEAIALTPDTVLITWLLPVTLEKRDELRYLIYQRKASKTNDVSDALLFSDPLRVDAVGAECVVEPCTAVVNDLIPNTVYNFQIEVVHKDHLPEEDPGEKSKEFAVTTLPLPGNFTSKASDANSLTFTWRPRMLDTGADTEAIGLIVQYRLKSEVGSVNQWANATSLLPTNQSREIPIANLEPDTWYEVNPVVFYEHFSKPWPIQATVFPFRLPTVLHNKTKPEGPSKPQSVLYGTDEKGFYVSWQQPQSNGGSKILGYRLQYKTSSQQDNWTLIPALVPSDKTVWRAEKSELFDENTIFQVAAVNDVGMSVWAGKEAGTLTTKIVPIVIAAAVITALIVIIICAICFAVWRRQRKRRPKYPDVFDLTPMPPGGEIDVTRHIPPDELRALPHVPRACITIARMLGKGAFGEVFEGLACNLPRVGPKSVRVAIKTLRQGSRDDERIKFLKEAIMMSGFDHPNIVKLLGVCMDSEPHWIVLELMEGGDLLTYLRSVRPTEVMPSQVSLKDLMSVISDVVKGCQYLEQHHHVHRDIAARNCLISTRNAALRTVKIADFGLTRDVYQEDYYRVDGQGLLPIRWMAPESMIDGLFTVKTDVWSFGVLIWEVMTLGHQPYHGRTNWDVLNYVRIGGLLNSPDYCPEQIYNLMRECWGFRPEQRPSFSQLTSEIASLCGFDNLSTESPFPPVFLPAAGLSGGVNNPAFSQTSAETSAGGNVKLFTTDASARFQRQGTSNSMRTGKHAQTAHSKRRAFGFRSLRKEKPKPPRPPSREELSEAENSRHSGASSSYGPRVFRPESGLSSGGESYTTSAYGYEVPLIKGLTNTARNQRLAEANNQSAAGGSTNPAYSPTTPDEKQYGKKPDLPTATFADPNVHRMSSFNHRYVPSPHASDVTLRKPHERPKKPAPPPPLDGVTVTGPAVQYADDDWPGRARDSAADWPESSRARDSDLDDKRPSQV